MLKKTNKTAKCLLFLGFMILVSIISVNIYQNLINTPKKIFIDAINSLTNDYQYFNKLENANYSFVASDFTYKGTISINMKSSILDYWKLTKESVDLSKYMKFLNNLDISYNIQKNDNSLLFLISNKLNNKTLDFSYYVNNNDHYIKMDNYSDKYVKINELVTDFKNNLIYLEDKDYLIEFIIKSLINNLSDEYFTTVKEEIEINHQNLNVNKNILTLDRKNVTTILNSVILDIKNDEKAYKMCLELYPNFNNVNIEVSDNIENDAVIYFNTYTDNNKLVKYELEFDNISEFLNLNVDNFVISFSKDDSTIEFFINKRKIANINFYNKDDGFKVDLYVNDSKLLMFDFDNNETMKVMSITSGILENNSFKLILSEIYDENILEEYDRLENKLLFDLSLFGFDILSLEMINVSDVYDNENINVPIDEFINISDLYFEDYDKIKSLLFDFITIEED